jgi:mRNA-degrading endonuclease RelE of RelBE toxin-antitoxin system
MSFEIFSIPPFDKQLKRLVKKYPSLKQEFIQLILSLENDPIQGTALGNNCYKIRLSIAGKSKGKSGGARVITHIKITKSAIYLLSIYDKSESEDLPIHLLYELLKQIP